MKDIILSAHQPAYLPWLGYFHKMALSDIFVILDDVQFEKNSFINRNKIKTSRGPIWLTVPVLISGHTTLTISDMKINNTANWREKHWKAIYLNYKKAPYFTKYSAFFEDLYKKEWHRLSDLLAYTTDFFVKELKLGTVLYKQSDLQIKSKKQQLILDLCANFKADVFVCGAMGRNYIDAADFSKHGTNVVFQEYKHPVYPQLWSGFVPNLSIIDFLFNIENDRLSEIMVDKNITQNNIRRSLL